MGRATEGCLQRAIYGIWDDCHHSRINQKVKMYMDLVCWRLVIVSVLQPQNMGALSGGSKQATYFPAAKSQPNLDLVALSLAQLQLQ